MHNNTLIKTKRALKYRIKEHQRDVIIKKDAVIPSHCNSTKHSMLWDNIKILDREDFWNRRSISEMIHIKRQNIGGKN